MGCGSCGTTANGKPSGCQSNGGCSSGGCNRLNVYNWLADLPLSDTSKPYPIVEISFNNGSRKDFFRNNTAHIFEKDDWVTVEGTGGFDVGHISLTGELVKLQMKKYGVSESSELKKVLRPSAERDIEVYRSTKERERDTLIRSRAIAKELNLEMKIAEAEFQADGKKVSFFYTADARVDFRELIKVFASDFKAKVEMRQIGARQESGKVGGIGSCGRELCCSSWLTDFKTVNTTAARYQNLSINQTKLSGQCGRLKCCLNYELDTYMDALHAFPDNAEHLEMATGRAYLQKKDIFRNLMWYSFSGSSKQYPLTIDRVQEILEANADGKKPDEIGAVEIQVRHKDAEKSIDMGFVNDVGQLTLSSLSKSGKKKQQAQQGKQRQKQQGKAQPNQQQGDAQKNQQQQQAAGNKQNKQRPQQQQKQNRPQNADAAAKPQQARPPQGQNKPQQAAAPKPQGNRDATKPASGPRPNQRPDRGPQQQKNKGNRPQNDKRTPGERPPNES